MAALGAEDLRPLIRTGELAKVKILPHALPDANGFLAAVRSHPGVTRAEIAGAVRRSVEIVPHIDIVAACEDPVEVAQSFTRIDGVIGVHSSFVLRKAVDTTALPLGYARAPA